MSKSSALAQIIHTGKNCDQNIITSVVFKYKGIEADIFKQKNRNSYIFILAFKKSFETNP